MNTTENNKLIAEFMGGVKDTIRPKDSEPIEVFRFDTIPMVADQLNYHDSWNSIMPVVEKIEGIGQTSVEIGRKHCRIQPIVYVLANDRMEWQLMHEERGGNKIEAVYKAVISFITWYNTNN